MNSDEYIRYIDTRNRYIMTKKIYDGCNKIEQTGGYPARFGVISYNGQKKFLISILSDILNARNSGDGDMALPIKSNVIFLQEVLRPNSRDATNASLYQRIADGKFVVSIADDLPMGDGAAVAAEAPMIARADPNPEGGKRHVLNIDLHRLPGWEGWTGRQFMWNGPEGGSSDTVILYKSSEILSYAIGSIPYVPGVSPYRPYSFIKCRLNHSLAPVDKFDDVLLVTIHKPSIGGGFIRAGYDTLVRLLGLKMCVFAMGDMNNSHESRHVKDMFSRQNIHSVGRPTHSGGHELDWAVSNERFRLEMNVFDPTLGEGSLRDSLREVLIGTMQDIEISVPRTSRRRTTVKSTMVSMLNPLLRYVGSMYADDKRRLREYLKENGMRLVHNDGRYEIVMVEEPEPRAEKRRLESGDVSEAPFIKSMQSSTSGRVGTSADPQLTPESVSRPPDPSRLLSLAPAADPRHSPGSNTHTYEGSLAAAIEFRLPVPRSARQDGLAETDAEPELIQRRPELRRSDHTCIYASFTYNQVAKRLIVERMMKYRRQMEDLKRSMFINDGDEDDGDESEDSM